MIYSLRHVLNALSFLSITVLAHAQTQTGVTQTVHAYTDYCEPVSGGAVIIDDGTSVTTSLTNGEGRTPSISVVAGSTAVITLGESTTPRGMTVGHRFVISTPAAEPGYSFVSSVGIFGQPVALWTTVDTGNLTSASGEQTVWSFTRVEGSAPLQFRSRVALLSNSSVIEAYGAYTSTVLISPQFSPRRGVLVRTADVDVGCDRLVLRINCDGCGFASKPSAQAFIVRQAVPSGTPAPSLRVETVIWEDNIAYVAVCGVLERGDNVILLGDSPLAQASRLSLTPVQYTSIASPIAAVPCQGNLMQCAPTPGAPECPSTAMSIDPSCPSRVVSHQCESTAKSIDSNYCCGGEGGSQTTVSFKVVAQIKFTSTQGMQGSILGSTITATQGQEVSFTKDFTIVQALGGNGLPAQCCWACQDEMRCVFIQDVESRSTKTYMISDEPGHKLWYTLRNPTCDLHSSLVNSCINITGPQTKVCNQ